MHSSSASPQEVKVCSEPQTGFGSLKLCLTKTKDRKDPFSKKGAPCTVRPLPLPDLPLTHPGVSPHTFLFSGVKDLLVLK